MHYLTGRISLVFFCLALFLSPAISEAKATFNFAASESNDLFHAMKKGGLRCRRFDTSLEAVNKADTGAPVLVLAESYPAETTAISAEVYQIAERKNLRLYVEYPSQVPGVELGPKRKIGWERGVVASDAFGATLPKLSILAVHECQFLTAPASNPLLVIARVAGFDNAVYGLPKDATPLLFEVPDKKILVATTKLSNVTTGRYAPARDWQTIWNFILSRLDPDHAPFAIKWTPLVLPAYSATEKLPARYEKRAFDAAAKWITQSQLLVPPSREKEIRDALVAGAETAPLPAEKLNGDGSLGILEGYASGVQHDGTQLQRLPLRADCHLESAMVLALDAHLNRDKESAVIARNLLDFVYVKSGMCGGVRADPKHTAFGMIGWGDIAPAWLVANYGDDNARAIQATILAAACLKSTAPGKKPVEAEQKKLDDVIAKALLANFRTTGKLGFRGDRLDNPQLGQHDWKHFWNAEPINYSPHFESGMWACYLWAYRQTGFRPFLEKTRNAIAMTMKVYPTGWRWNDQVERARMLLCLAWLVRADDTPEHRGWMKSVAMDLLKRQEPNGAIHEWLGGSGGGHYQIPASNEAYGTAETPLIQKNGDPASDQLYTTGFTLFGLHEAIAATQDAELKKGADKLAEFLCRIQVRSKQFPFVDGWWFRAFDDRRWEFWASSADIGWGAWSLEAGWAQAWGATTFALRDMKTSFWDFTANEGFATTFNHWKGQMLE